MSRIGTLEFEAAVAKLVMEVKGIQRNCPAGHRVVVEVNYRYVPAMPAVILKEVKPAKLVKSEEPFTREHFDALLDLPLSGADREFVEYFRKRNNKPMTPSEWIAAGFAEHGRIASINHSCLKNGLWIRFCENRVVPKGVGCWPRLQHQFFVMKEKGVRM